MTDALGNQTITLFNEQDKPETIIKKNSIGLLLAQKELSYDCLGNLIHTKETVISNGTILRKIQTLWKYNKVSQLTSITEALGTPEQKITEFAYDSWGQKSKIIKPDGTVLSHQYDSNGRLKTLKSSDKRIDYTYYYNKNDDLITVQDPNHSQSTHRVYDKNGRMTSETLATGFKIQYLYDKIGRPTEALLADGSSIRYQYDSAHLKKVIRIKNNQEAYFHEYTTYDLGGTLLKSKMPGHAGNIQFNNTIKGCLKEIKCAAYSETLTLNEVGHITSCSSDFINQEYTYDDLYQLSSEKGAINHTYEHDSLYNCIVKDDFCQTANALNQIHQLKHATFTYDANGNRSKSINGENEVKYIYDGFDRLVEFIIGNRKTVYTYDAFNRRLSKSQFESDKLLSKIHYIYFGQNEVGSFDENKKIQEFRILGVGHGAEIGATVAIEMQNEVFIPINDHNGNIVALLDLKGEKCGTYVYSAFGEEIMIEGVISPWRFSSKRVDEESNLVNFGRRYYDPTVARWLTPDPIGFGGGPNLYAYVLNSPLDHIDLYGLQGNWASSTWNACFSPNSCFREWGEKLIKLPGLITEFVGYHLVPLPVVRDAVMMLGRTMQGQTPHFYIDWNHSEYLGYVGTKENKDNIGYLGVLGQLTSKDDAIQTAQKFSDARDGQLFHVFYNASNGLAMDLLESLGLILGLPLEAPRKFAQTEKMLFEYYKELRIPGHSQGGLVIDRSFSYLSREELGNINVATIGSGKIIDNPHLRSSINYVSIGDPIPFLADPFGILKNTLRKDGPIKYQTSGSIPLYAHLLHGPSYGNLINPTKKSKTK